jgi:hypothetical protein
MNPARRSLFSTFLDRWHASGDRRAACRYAPVHDAVTMRWTQDGSCRTQSCKLLDISLSGMSVLSQVAPEGAREVDIKSGTDPEAEDRPWVSLQLVRVVPLKRKGPFKVQLRFPEGCPYDLFREITAGDAFEGRIANTAAEFDPRYWR